MPLLTELETTFSDVPFYRHAAPNGATACLRQGAQTLARTGKVSVEDKLVRFTRPGLTEEYSVSVDGVRQDFIIESPPLNPQPSTLNQSAGDLRVELALSGARAEAASGGARLRLEGSGRALAYSRLRVEDATGRELTARLEVLSPDRLAVSVADANATYPVRIDPTFSDADWVSLGSGMNNWVNALAVSGTNLYAGGYFTNAGGAPANYIAKWDGGAWSVLGSGVSGENTTVNALAVSGTNLYAGGYFTNAGGVSANCIAKWDGSTWSALGSGLGPIGNSWVNALAVSGTNLYAAGWFTNAGGVLVTNIAKWDGSAWSALGSGIGGYVYALAVSGTNLYAGGLFTTAGGVSANCIAKWDGSAWSAVGSGIAGSTPNGSFPSVHGLAVSGTDLYAGGYFSTAGGVPPTSANCIAKWDGSVWSALGTGMDERVYALAVSETNLYAGGWFTTAGGAPANYIAKWDGSAWSALGSAVNNMVNALAADGAGHLFVGGDFSLAGTNVSPCIAEANVGTPGSPLIVASPASLTVAVGGTADFQVAANGSPPLVYQWIFNGTTAIEGATSAVLSLTNIQFTQAGAYSVTVSNLYGAVTSAPALLQVFPRGIVVTNSEADLRAAMAEGGTVIFACDGTITLNNTITNTLDTVLDGSGHQVTISGGGAVRVFCVNTSANFTVVNLTIANGQASSGAGILNAGGFVNATNCVFSGNSALASGSSGGAGGAIQNLGGEVYLSACVFRSNQASGAVSNGVGGLSGGSGWGGALDNSGTLTADLCNFIANSATGAPGNNSGYGVEEAGIPGGSGGSGAGGAICNFGTATIFRSMFTSNSAAGGAGGLGNCCGGCMVTNSYAPPGDDGGPGGGGVGGAIYNAGNACVLNSTLAFNSGSGGTGGWGGMGVSTAYYGNGGNGGNGGMGGNGIGAVFSSSELELINSTFVSNSASAGDGGVGGPGGWANCMSGVGVGGYGGNGGNGGSGGSGSGAIAISGGGIANCTFAMNSGRSGAGEAGGVGGTSFSPVGGGPGNPGSSGGNGTSWGGIIGGSLVNTLLATNTPGGNGSGITDLGHNLSSDSTCNFTTIGSMNNTDPKLGPLANNGGPTLTMALLPGSPAIDAGNTSLAPATDQRGFPRPAGLAADIGAFEYGSVMPTVAISRSGANGLNILASGNAGQPCRLLVSTDLLNWAPIATNQIASGGTVQFIVSRDPGSVCQFYRLVMP
jgi:hypothetical protein